MKIYILVAAYFTTTLATNDGFCEKTFFYHQIHGYGYDIRCEKLNNQTFSELSTATVHNPIQLTINSSNLHAIKWHISSNLPQLRRITITTSSLVDTNLFENLNYLKILTIKNSTVNRNSYVGINGLINLNKLILNNNSLEYLKFNNTISNLRHLDLDNNFIGTIDDISPCIFPYLEILSIRFNKIKRVNNIDCLRNLVCLYLDSNSIDYVNVNISTLITLSLSFNKLKFIKRSLGKMEHLEYLNLQGNYLEYLDNFSQFPNLKYLNLKDNKLVTLNEKTFAYNVKLNHINLDNNKLNQIYLNLSITELLLSNNQINSILFIIPLRSLKKLDLSLNKINKIPNKIFNNLESLTFLNLSFNPLQENIYKDSFYGLIHLRILDLFNTRIKQFKSSNLPNLIELNISSNSLENITDFNNLVSLRVLNISYNHIFNVQATSIANLKHLSIIDLEGNHLRSIEYIQLLAQLPNLQIINIRNNLLECEFLNEMIGYFQNNNVTFSIDNKLNYDKENIAEIYCKQQELLIHSESLRQKQGGNPVGYNKYNAFLIFATLIAVLLVLLFILYALRLHFNNKAYICDTIQLLDR